MHRRPYPMMTMPVGWASWTPEVTRVENVISGWTGVVVEVMNRGGGNNKVKVRWDKNGAVGWNNPANLKVVLAESLPTRQQQAVTLLAAHEGRLDQPAFCKLMWTGHGVGPSQSADLLGALKRKGLIELVDRERHIWALKDQ